MVAYAPSKSLTSFDLHSEEVRPMLKRYLLAPGPTPVPPEVLLAMARPMIHHRAPEFDKLFAEVREDLKWLFQTRNDVLILASSGTGGMEGSVSNFLSPGDRPSRSTAASSASVGRSCVRRSERRSLS